MGLIGRLRLQLGLLCVVGLGGACADTGASSSKAACAGGVAVASGAMCYFSGAITESDQQCPPELPYRYSGDGWWLCSDRDDLDTAAIDAAVREGGHDDAPDAAPSDDASGPDAVTSDDAQAGNCRSDDECAAGMVCMGNVCVPREDRPDGSDAVDGRDGATDDDAIQRADGRDDARDGADAIDHDGGPSDDGRDDDAIIGCRTDDECAVGQICVRNTCILDDGNDGSTDDGSTDDGCIDRDGDGRCDGPEAVTPTPFSGACAVDVDADGSCAGLDPDDNDPSVRDVGIRLDDQGKTDLVVCYADASVWARVLAEGLQLISYDQCVGLDFCVLDPAYFFAGVADPAALSAQRAALCADRPAAYVESEQDFSGAADLVCDPGGSATDGQTFCWYELGICKDSAGAPTECQQPSGCRDDNRDGVCDPP